MPDSAPQGRRERHGAEQRQDASRANLPVPVAFEPSGEMFMATHFAPTHRDQNAPRMYYAVDIAKTKKAYIGYIGVHLTNTRTN